MMTKRTRAWLWFTTLNIVAAFALGTSYIRHTNIAIGSQAWLFAIVALAGQVGLINGLIGATIALAARTGRGETVLRVLGPLLFSIVTLFLFVDQRVYAFFHFHMNGLVWNVLTTSGGWETMHVPLYDVLFFFGVCATIMTVEFGALIWLTRRQGTSGPGFWHAHSWLRLAAIVLAFVALDKAVYAVGDLYQVADITRTARVVPFYQPLTIKKIAKRIAGIAVDELPFKPVDPARSFLSYPAKPLRVAPPARDYNMVWFVLDSWRSDALSAELTPNLWAFKSRCQVFNRHVSGGNATRFGFFSLFYGLYGSYWHNFLSEGRDPVLIDRLIDLNYRFKILASVPLTSPEFRQTIYKRIPGAVADNLPGEWPWQKDQAMIDQLNAFVATKDKRPFFASLFFDSTHTGYSFPLTDQFVRYRPFSDSLHYSEFGNADRLKEDTNRYKNAVHYVDDLIARALRTLAKNGQLSNTIVLITGDHGEEFGERGNWGHNGSFGPEQVRVPFLLFVPGRAPQEIDRLTSHHDVVPTILPMLGVTNPPADYSVGRSLFDAEADPFAVSCDWDRCGMIDAGGAVVFGVRSYNLAEMDALDAEYKPASEPRKMIAARSSRLVRIMEQMSLFYR